MTRPLLRTLTVIVLALTPWAGLWALDAEGDLQITHTLVAVVAGPPGTPAQEVGVDRTLAQAAVSHTQTLAEGLTLGATGWASVDTLPSGNPQRLPTRKMTFTSHILEGWLGWEPLPGALSLGAGKRVLHPSSGFSHTPLDFVDRGGETSGAQAAAHWEEGWVGAQASGFGDFWSASVYAAPSLDWDQKADEAGLKYLSASQPEGFVQGRLGLSLGTTDLKAVVLRKGTTNRVGLGLDGGWGDSLTLRAEAAADPDPQSPRADTLAGFTWTGADQSTLMAELWADNRTGTWAKTAFFRVAGKVDPALEADAWTQVDLADASGLAGASLTWTAPKVALAGSWLGSWGEPSTRFGASALRWKLTAEVKTYY